MCKQKKNFLNKKDKSDNKLTKDLRDFLDGYYKKVRIGKVGLSGFSSCWENSCTFLYIFCQDFECLGI